MVWIVFVLWFCLWWFFCVVYLIFSLFGCILMFFYMLFLFYWFGSGVRLLFFLKGGGFLMMVCVMFMWEFWGKDVDLGLSLFDVLLFDECLVLCCIWILVRWIVFSWCIYVEFLRYEGIKNWFFLKCDVLLILFGVVNMLNVCEKEGVLLFFF